jgi:hypothetical protein
MCSGFAAYYFKDFYFKRIRTIFADRSAECPVTTLSEGASDVFTPAALQGLYGRAILDIGDAYVFELAYSQAIDNVVTVKTTLSLHHVDRIS